MSQRKVRPLPTEWSPTTQAAECDGFLKAQVRANREAGVGALQPENGAR